MNVFDFFDKAKPKLRRDGYLAESIQDEELATAFEMKDFIEKNYHHYDGASTYIRTQADFFRNLGEKQGIDSTKDRAKMAALVMKFASLWRRVWDLTFSNENNALL